MADERYWVDLYSNIENLTDEQFETLVNGLGGVQSCPIIYDESLWMNVNNIKFSSDNEQKTYYKKNTRYSPCNNNANDFSKVA